MNDPIIDTLDAKTEKAIGIIREYEPIAVQMSPLGYRVGMSGGKDSSVLVDLVIKSGVKATIFHNLTSMDCPETIYFIRDEQKRIEKMGYHLEILSNKMKDGTSWNFSKLFERRGLPIGMNRICCEILKEVPNPGQFSIFGVRHSESVKRLLHRHEFEINTRNAERILANDNEGRALVEHCMKKSTMVLNPIISWQDEDIWRYIKRERLPYNPLYDLGYTRIGCIGCPQAPLAKRLRDYERYPKYKNAMYKAAKRSYDNFIETCKTPSVLKNFKESFPTYDHYWNYFVYGPTAKAKVNDRHLGIIAETIDRELDKVELRRLMPRKVYDKWRDRG